MVIRHIWSEFWILRVWLTNIFGVAQQYNGQRYLGQQLNCSTAIHTGQRYLGSSQTVPELHIGQHSFLRMICDKSLPVQEVLGLGHTTFRSFYYKSYSILSDNVQ